MSTLSNEYNINISKASDEVLNWLIANVENYIDNHAKQFKIDLIIDRHNKEMPELKRLQALYRTLPEKKLKLPDCEDIIKEYNKLMKDKDVKAIVKESALLKKDYDTITSEIHKAIKKDKEKLDILFKRMAFYYELVGFNKGKELLRELNGGVWVTNFDYEDFDVGVKVKAPAYKVNNEETGEVETIQGEDKSYVIGEGFTVWIEISFTSEKMTSIF